jgi:DNA polymerase-4
VEEPETIKSISNEHTFDEDIKDEDLARDTIMYLSEKVSRRLRRSRYKCRTVTLKIRFSDFKTFTRAVTLRYPTSFVIDLYQNSLSGLSDFDLGKKAVRLLGVKASNLVEDSLQTDLFEDSAEGKEKNEKIHKALDRIKDRFGERSIGYRNAGHS